jgi:hypothetical protein
VTVTPELALSLKVIPSLPLLSALLPLMSEALSVWRPTPFDCRTLFVYCEAEPPRGAHSRVRRRAASPNL